MELIYNDLGSAARIVTCEADRTGVRLVLDISDTVRGCVRFRYDQPLVVPQSDITQLDLQYRNDRYGHLVWELNIEAHAMDEPLAIALCAIQPPDKPYTYTDEDFAAFKADFETRSSRYPDDAQIFPQWQTQQRERLRGLIMAGAPLPDADGAAKYEPVEQRETFTIERVTYRSRAGCQTAGLLALPRGASRQSPVPLVVGLHGHEATWGAADLGAFTEGHIDDFMAYFAMRGFAVFQPATLDHLLQDETWTLYGQWITDALAGLRTVCQRAEIDRERIAVVGLSTGGLLAQLVGAMELSVRCVVTAGIFTTRNHVFRHMRVPPHCDCGGHRHLSLEMEQADILTLVAPRPVQIMHGRADGAMCPGADASMLDLAWNTGVFPQREFDVAIEDVRGAYALRGDAEALAVHFHDGGHAVDNQAAHAFVAHALHVES